jgi:hypothetical protein
MNNRFNGDKMKEISVKKFLDYALIVIFYFGILGIAIRMITNLEQWIFLPFFPDILDFVFIIIGSTYLTYKVVRKREN